MVIGPAVQNLCEKFMQWSNSLGLHADFNEAQPWVYNPQTGQNQLSRGQTTVKTAFTLCTTNLTAAAAAV